MLAKQGELKALEKLEDLELYFNSAHFASDTMMTAKIFLSPIPAKAVFNK